NRLKPGYEAPVCIVTSLGHSAHEPSRNRTILIGLVRDERNPLATRFELRSPNPKSNTYLVLASSYMAMLDGVRSALEAGKTPEELEKSISKSLGEEDFYLETEREYRTEKDVFEDFTEEERKRRFKYAGHVWENLHFCKTSGKSRCDLGEGVFSRLPSSLTRRTPNQWKPSFTTDYS
ncbi:MAG: glutamine synthetase, partial [Anaerovoracaceae bacterium]